MYTVFDGVFISLMESVIDKTVRMHRKI